MTPTQFEVCEERVPYGNDVTVVERDGVVYVDGVPFTPEMIAAFSKPDTPRPRRVMTKEEILSLQVPCNARQFRPVSPQLLIEVGTTCRNQPRAP